MRFWDSSALVPLLVDEPGTKRASTLLAADPDVVVWWGTEVECASALERRAREGALAPDARRSALERLEVLSVAWSEILATSEVRLQALRVLRLHSLRAADALQLAAAVVWARHAPKGYPFLSADERLRAAAEAEGFTVGP